MLFGSFSLVWFGAAAEHNKHLPLLRTRSSAFLGRGEGDEPEATSVCLGLVDTSEWKFLEQEESDRVTRHSYFSPQSHSR